MTAESCPGLCETERTSSAPTSRCRAKPTLSALDVGACKAVYTGSIRSAPLRNSLADGGLGRSQRSRLPRLSAKPGRYRRCREARVCPTVGAP